MNESPELQKQLGVVAVFSISAGAMISSGLFVLPAVVYSYTGPSIFLAYILAAVLVIPAMLSKAELATAMPKSGGVYFFIHRSMGALFGTFAGFASWFSLSLKSAFALMGIGVLLGPLLPDIGVDMVKIVAFAFTLLFILINIVSVRESGTLQIVLVFLLIGILVLYVAMGFEHVEIGRYVPFMPGGWLSICTATGMIFVSFGGLTKIASVAEEVKNPKKTIPAGMFSAFAVVTLLYFLTIFVTTGLLDPAEFGQTLTPLSLGASKFAGRFGYVALAAAAMLAFLTTSNAGLLAASRGPLAMSKDHLLPAWFARVNLKLKTPVPSVLTTGVFMILVITFLDLETLVKVASTMKLLLFAFVNLSVILMRESRIVSYKPSFRAPLYPYLQIAGIIVYLLLIIEMGLVPLFITLGFFLISLLWYFLYSKSRNLKVSALINIVERITSKTIKSNRLTDELREILVKRDEIIEDRFDGLIKKAEIIDLEEETGVDGLFHLLSGVLSDRFGQSAQTVYQLLVGREKDSTTVIHDGLAIPHIVVEGISDFDIIIVRSKRGIQFGENIPPVHIVFALAGTKDERNFHLQALMAVAQIVQNRGFMVGWIKAGSREDLRSLILLAQRVRKAQV